MTGKSQYPGPYSPAREERVAAALRENLRKRKSQQQARDAMNKPEITDKAR
jgi:hypothetical protein